MECRVVREVIKNGVALQMKCEVGSHLIQAQKDAHKYQVLIQRVEYTD